MKSITFPADYARFRPQACQCDPPGYRERQETPRDSLRWPSGDKNKIVGERPKCDYRDRKKQNIAGVRVVGSFRDQRGFHPGIIWNRACLCAAFWKISADSHSLSLARADKLRPAQAENTEQAPRRRHSLWRLAAQKITQ